jgi:competence protein ComEA
MFTRNLFAVLAMAALTTAPVLAQTTATPPLTRPPVTTTPSPAARPTTPAAPAVAPAVSPATKKTNLNTATSAELDALPDVGKARTKVIMDERAKGNFKDWADFDKRTTGTSINKGVKAKIQDLVTF